MINYYTIFSKQRILICSLFILYIIGTTVPLHAQSCDLTSDLNRVIELAPTTDSTIIQFYEFQQSQQREIKRISKEVFTTYISGDWTAKDEQVLLGCITSSENKMYFKRATQQVFWLESLNYLSKSGGTKARIVELINMADVYSFKLFGHSDKNSIQRKKGGFHRGRKSLFLNYAKITPNEWFTYFVHEIAHGIDSTLADSLSIYADTKRAKTIGTLIHKYKSIGELTISEKEYINIWLEAALNRGFLAEVRAWALTLSVYEEGLNDGSFEEVKWVENIIHQKKSNENYLDFLLRFLNDSFVDPKENIFSNTIIQQALKRLRQDYLSGARPVPVSDEFTRMMNSN